MFSKEYFSLKVGQDFEVFLNTVREWILQNPEAVVLVPENAYSEFVHDINKLSTPDEKPGCSFDITIWDRDEEYVCDSEEVLLVLRTDLPPDAFYDGLDRPTNAYKNEVITRIDELVQQVDRELRFRFERAAA